MHNNPASSSEAAAIKPKRAAWRRLAIVVAGVVVVLLLSYIGVVRFWLPGYVRNHWIPQISDALGAVVVVDQIIPKPLTGSVELVGPELKDLDGNRLATSRLIKLRADLLSVYRQDTIHLSSLQIQGGEVWISTDQTNALNWQPLIDKARELAADENSQQPTSPLKVVLNRTRVQASTLHIKRHGHAPIDINLHDLSIGSLSTEKTRPCPIDLNANFLDADLKIDGELWPNEHHLVQAKVTVDDIDAAAMVAMLNPPPQNVPSKPSTASTTPARPLVELTEGAISLAQDLQVKIKPSGTEAWAVTGEGGIKLAGVKNLLLKQPVPVTLSSSSISMDGRWSLSQPIASKPLAYQFAGDLSSQKSEVVFRQPNTTQGVFEKLSITGFETSSQQAAISFKDIQVVEPDFIVLLPKRDPAPAGADPKEKTSSPPANASPNPAPSSASQFGLASGGLWDEVFRMLNRSSLKLINGRLQLTDPTYPQTAPLLVTKINAATLAGQIQIQAIASLLDQSSLTASVKLNRDAQGLSGETQLAIESLPLPPLSHYGESLTGLMVNQGKMSLQMPLTITHNKLVGRVGFNFEKLNLGNRSKLPNAPDQATSNKVASAVDLLTDREGNLNAQIDITGDLTSPQFSTHRLVTRAVGQLVQRMLTSPIDLIASMFGGEPGVDYSTLQFVPGTTRPFANDDIKLKVLANTLKSRPDIVLRVIGCFEPRLDRGALKTQGQRDEFFDKTSDRMSRDFRLNAKPGFGAKGTSLQIDIQLRQLARARADWVADQLTTKHGVDPEQLKTSINLSTTASADQQAMVRFELPPDVDRAEPAAPKSK